MTLKRFDAILLALTYIHMMPPSYKDQFWEVRQITTAWNQNMTKIFTPSWVLFLDEPIPPWNNHWTCPGWIFVPRKPRPFDNEYHSICRAKMMIMYAIEIVEGLDMPPQKPWDPNERLGKTVGLLLHLCQSIYSRGFVVILDSGFCILQGDINPLEEKSLCCSCNKKAEVLAKACTWCCNGQENGGKGGW
jgi:hypothetical protein